MTSIRLTITELARFANVSEELLKEAIGSGVHFRTLDDAESFGLDLKAVAKYQRFLEWIRKHPGK